MADRHADRIRTAADTFKTAYDAFVAALEAMDDESARRPAANGGWSAAQIAWHVAESNRLTAATLSGALPGARRADGFIEDPVVLSRIPPKVETPIPALNPPADVSRDDALTKLRWSAAPTLKAIETLTPDRAANFTVKMPFGVLNLYQLAELVGAHVGRHKEQLDRCLQTV
jgi:DinB family protein